jgi:hypothetical protein
MALMMDLPYALFDIPAERIFGQYSLNFVHSCARPLVWSIQHENKIHTFLCRNWLFLGVFWGLGSNGTGFTHKELKVV